MLDEFTGTEIAIIGMAGRYPKSPNLNVFWRHLCDGDELISFFTDEELLAQGADPAMLRNPSFVKAAGVLEDTELFDAAFFGFMPREAALMDPQQRLLLECAWDAFENAGYAPGRYDGLIGVYVGAVENTYLLFNLMTNPEVRSMPLLPVIFVNGRDYLPTRISYKLNLRGPSSLVQSACSTSLVAIHNACQSLINGECDMALAGGVSVLVHQRMGYLYQEGGIVSPDGHCRSFDSQAQGTIFSSGLGAVVLKPLEKALSDGDSIRAIIRGSAVNNDGSVKVSYTAPSVSGQAEVIVEALANAGISASTINYVETHGTATVMSDTIEVQALTQAFRKMTDASGFCAIGTVKSNVGHLDAAAGVTGVIKTVLSLEHKQIPPSLHFNTPNPQISFGSSPFYVNTQLTEWPAGSTPRRAGVSSFGIGGTNAHLVLEEAPPQASSGSSRPWHLLVLSAKTESALEAIATNIAQHLREHPQENLADVAYTLQVGRTPFVYRRALVCCDRDSALAALKQGHTTAPFDRPMPISAQTREDRPTVFMFPGLGAQYAGMAHELYEYEPYFREQIDRCVALLQPILGLDLRDVLYPEGHRTKNKEQNREHYNQGSGVRGQGSDVDASQTQNSELKTFPPSPISHPPSPIPLLDQTWLAHPALFVVEYVLAQLWMSWGVRPRAMIGHSIGEYVAACLAGVFTLEDALALVVARSRLMQQTQPGAMLAVSLSEEELRQHAPTLDLAAVNASNKCVASGPAWSILELEHALTAEQVICRRLQTTHAFHSAMMDSVLEEFTAEVRRVRLRPPQIPFVSNLTGTWINAEQATDPTYWVRHLRQTVRFADGLHTLLADFSGALLEVGPGQTLGVLARQQCDREADQVVCSSLRYAQEDESDVALILKTVGQLWLAGVSIDWGGLYAQERRRRVPLPTYPFERKRYWIDPARMEGQAATVVAAPAPVATAELPTADPQERESDLPPAIEPVEPGESTAPAPIHLNGAHAESTDRETRSRRNNRALEDIVAQQIEVFWEQLHMLRDDRSKKRRGL